MATYFQGAVKSGDGFSETATGVGTAVFSQTALVNSNATLKSEAVFVLPRNAQIVDIVADVLTAYNPTTSTVGATSAATLTVGSTSAGTQYAGAVDAKTAGRARPTFTAAQLAAMANINGNTSVYATITSSENPPTAGSARVTVLYTGGAL